MGLFSDRWYLAVFIQGRVSIFRPCVPSRKMRARKNKGGGCRFPRPRLRLPVFLRRLIKVIPALIVIGINLYPLRILLLSVILSFTFPFAPAGFGPAAEKSVRREVN